MLFHIGQSCEDAVTLSFGTFGNRFSLDFYEDHVGCRRYDGTEDLSSDLSAVEAMVEARAAASAPASEIAAKNVTANGVTAHSCGMGRLLDFTANLRANGIHHAIEQHSSEALEVSFTVEGKRVEVEFSGDGVLYSEFDAQAASVFDEAAIRGEIEVFNRPYQSVTRMRKESVHVAE